MGIVLAILIFGLIIFIHEMGHFLLAKANGIRVDEFSLGMGPRLISFTRGETRYSLKILPIGGSCMMGEDDADDMSEGSFNTKPVWARICVVAAGAVFNFILAFLLAMILVGSDGYDKPVLSGVMEGYAAGEAGLREGDTIIRMNNRKINLWREVRYYTMLHPGKTVDLVYERDGRKHEVVLTPQAGEDGSYLLGVMGPVKNESANALTIFQYAAYEVKFTIVSTVESIGMLIRGKVGADQLTGPVGIVNIVDDTYNESKSYGAKTVALQMLSLALLLTANLGVMNLLPIPALDGGRLVFLIIEAIRGKRVPPEKEARVHMIGMALLLALMAFVFYNDIRRLI